MKLLFISRWFPYPPDNGARLRAFNLIKQLASNYQLSLLSFTDQPVTQAQIDALAQYCVRIRTVPFKNFVANDWKAKVGYFSWQPRSVTSTFSRAMWHLAREESHTFAPDVVVATQLGAAPYALNVPNATRILEEVEVGLLLAKHDSGTSAQQQLRTMLTQWKSRNYIRRLLRQFHGCTVVSDQEQQMLRAIVGSSLPIAVIPNGVEMPVPRTQPIVPEPNSLIYAGALTYSANFDAAQYFLKEIFPKIRQVHPEATLRITGRNEGVPIAELGCLEGVEFSGYVQDIQSVIASSWASVVPLRQGGGTRLKILESLAQATPVVATSKGAEGLKLEAERDLLVADDPSEFCRQTVRLLRDPALRAALGRQGRSTVADQYQWHSIGSALGNFVTSVKESN